MKTVKRLFALLLCLMLTLTACSSAETPKSKNIWLIAKSNGSEFWHSAIAGANAAKSEYNAALTVAAPESEDDYESQNEYIRRAIADGADAIVLSAISASDNAKAVDEAAAAGVKIVVIDSGVNSSAAKVFIGTDNVGAGKKVAEAALNACEGVLNIGIINCGHLSQNVKEREQGFLEKIEESGRMGEIYSNNIRSDSSAAERRTGELLEEHPDINLVVAFNEILTVGASTALEKLGTAGTIAFVGFDSNPKDLDLLQTGEVSALIVQNPYAMGYLGVETACRIVDGEPVENYVDTSTVVITRENMFTYDSQRILFPFS